MKKRIIILIYVILLLINRSFSQKFSYLSKDTIIDFNSGYLKTNEYRNFILEYNNILYSNKIYRKNDNKIIVEYTRLNDSMFLMCEYFEDGLVKSKGPVIIAENLFTIDTIKFFSAFEQKKIKEVKYLKPLLKHGRWEYYDSYSVKNVGSYSYDKKEGLWSKYYPIHSDEILGEEETYSKDKKTFPIESQNYSLDIKNTIDDVWMITDCENIPNRLVLEKEDVMNTNDVKDYFIFKENEVIKSIGSLCESTIKNNKIEKGSWSTLSSNYLKLIFKGKKESLYEILYANPKLMVLWQHY